MSLSEPGDVLLRRAGVLAALGLLAFAAVLLLDVLPATATAAVNNLVQLAAASAAAGCCAVAARRATSSANRWMWRLLALASGSWAVGQAIWSWYELVDGRELPFPSLADAGFLLFPPLAAAGLLVLPAGRGAWTSGLRNLLDGLVAAVSLLILSWASSIGATVTADGPDQLTTTLAVAYPLGDVVVLTLALLILSGAAPGRRAVLGPLALGLALLAAADSAFLYLTANGSYTSVLALCDIGWASGFTLLALAALTASVGAVGDLRPLAQQPGEPAARGRDDGLVLLPSRLRLMLPYLPLLAAQAVVTTQLLTGDRRAPAFEVVLALALVLLVLARQYVTLADNRALLLELHAQREAARHAALHDPLTGLANRTLFADRVSHALTLRLREAQTISVLFCDLDDFKDVNDGLGHAAGDALLVSVAARLRSGLRPSDTVARLGGDEFAVLLQGSPEPPEMIAGRIVAALGEPLTVVGRPVTVSVSVGVATAHAGSDLTSVELLRRADTAMYAAKGSGKAIWVSYDPRRHDLHPDGGVLQVAVGAHDSATPSGV